MRIARVLTSFALLTAVGAATLRADFKDFSNRCFPGTVRACASLQVQTYLLNPNVPGSGTGVFIFVRNLQGWNWGIDNTGGSVITRIGLTAPIPITPNSALTVFSSGAQTVGSPSTPWKLRNPGGLGGTIELTAGLAPAPGETGSVAGGIAGCNAPYGGFPSSYYRTCGPASYGGWVGFFFTTSNDWSANSAEVAFLTQRSVVADVNGYRGFECGSVAGGGRDECPVVTPEPVTMLLLGSGLAGIGGVGVIRRRRGKDVTSD